MQNETAYGLLVTNQQRRGYVLGAWGMYSSIKDFTNAYQIGNKAGMIEATADFIMGGIGFFPGWGTVASLGYFLVAKPLYHYYTKP